MNKLRMIAMCLFAMLAMGTGLRAQEVTVVLNPGWTWISCPSTEAVGFATALGDFVPMQGDVIKSQWGSVIYRNGQWKGTISQFNPGYGYHYYSNRTVPAILTFNAQQPVPQVIVTTSEPLLITAISAMGGGEVTVSDGTYILVKGLCWAAHEDPTTNDDFYQEAESGVGSFSISMTDLNISTAYYVRAYAVTPNGTIYGDQKSFTTRDGIPTLTTANVSSITGISATCGGNITDNCGLNVSARGVCWSISPDPTLADLHTTDGTGTGSFISNITGLSVSTTYYVRAYATTAGGTGYGEQKVFTTRNGIPILTTSDVTNITAVSATCGGYISTNGGLNVTARGVCWSTTSNPTIADSHTTNGTGTGSFSSSITGLSINTTYYVRAYATTAVGTAYGEEKTFTTRDGIPTLTTVAIWNITGNSARSGGNIIDDGGLNVMVRGVCWSTVPNPTVSDNHTTNGTSMGSFNSIITGLDFSTTYYVRAYATTNSGTGYGNQLSFTTENDLAFIDLGLPSGLLWATCNVGANTPYDCGGYFAWGEIQLKSTYNWDTYQYSNDGFYEAFWDYSTNGTGYNFFPYLTKYCNDSEYGYQGFTDTLTTLLPEDDAATANWGNGWRMPTQAEFQELLHNTTVTWTNQNGVNGMLFTASNDNNLFLPAAGCRTDNNLNGAGNYGFYWTSSLDTYDPYDAWFFCFNSEDYYIINNSRYAGQSVRPVRVASQN